MDGHLASEPGPLVSAGLEDPGNMIPDIDIASSPHTPTRGDQPHLQPTPPSVGRSPDVEVPAAQGIVEPPSGYHNEHNALQAGPPGSYAPDSQGRAALGGHQHHGGTSHLNARFAQHFARLTAQDPPTDGHRHDSSPADPHTAPTQQTALIACQVRAVELDVSSMVERLNDVMSQMTEYQHQTNARLSYLERAWHHQRLAYSQAQYHHHHHHQDRQATNAPVPTYRSAYEPMPAQAPVPVHTQMPNSQYQYHAPPVQQPQSQPQYASHNHRCDNIYCPMCYH